MAAFTFLVFLGVCLFLFLAIVLPTLKGAGAIRLGADSATYLAVADAVRSGGAQGVAYITLTGNFVGPVALALLLKSGFAIVLFNLILFLAGIYAAGRATGIDRWALCVLLILNAETLVSIITLNKEILALFSVLLLGKYLYSSSRSKILLAVVLLFALMARWQQFAIVLLFLFLRRQGSRLARNPRAAIALIVFLMTIAYPVASSRLDLSELTVQGETGGTVTKLNAMQAHFLFPLVVAPKAFLNLAGQLATPWYYFQGYSGLDENDWQNRYIIQLHTIAMLLLCIGIVARGKLRLSEPFIFLGVLYLVVTALTPFVQPRYQYPVYGLLCLEMARSEPQRHIPIKRLRWL